MTRSRYRGLVLALFFGLSVIAPCLTGGIGEDASDDPTPMAECGGGEIPQAAHVCASSFHPAPSHGTPQADPPVAAKLLAVPPLMVSTIQGSGCRIADPGEVEHAPPPYLLHRALLI